MGGKVILEMEEVTIKVEQGMQPASTEVTISPILKARNLHYVS